MLWFNRRKEYQRTPDSRVFELRHTWADGGADFFIATPGGRGSLCVHIFERETGAGAAFNMNPDEAREFIAFLQSEVAPEIEAEAE